MAITVGTIFECNASATAGNVNGGGFNRARTPAISNATITSPSGASPVLATASYNFVAGDVGAWIYFPTQTNITAGFYQIASVAGNAATLSADIGQGETISSQIVSVTTVQGVGTATSGVSFLIDYSRSTAAIASMTDLASANGTTNPATITSVAAPFGINHVGNIIHVTAGTNWTAGWYEIVSVAVVTATLDRAVGTAVSLTSGTAAVGGAMSLNATGTGIGVSDFFSILSSNTNGCLYFIKSGNYTLGGAVAQGNGNYIEGYTTRRGDNPIVASNMPKITQAANIWTAGWSCVIRNVYFTGTANPLIVTPTTLGGCDVLFCKLENTGTSPCINVNAGTVAGCDICAIAGLGVQMLNGNGVAFANYIHDCSQGIVCSTASGNVVINNLIVGCYTNGINLISGGVAIGNTIYGNGSLDAVGINSQLYGVIAMNNIISGMATGITNAGAAVDYSHTYDYNDLFGNTANTSQAVLSKNCITTDPAFTSVVTRSGSTATTTAGNHLVQSGASFVTWGIVAGDVIRIKTGTGVTLKNYQILSVDSETQITTVQTLSADATADKVWRIIPIANRNFTVGSNVRAVGIPGAFIGNSNVVGYLDLGALQGSATSSGGGTVTSGISLINGVSGSKLSGTN